MSADVANNRTSFLINSQVPDFVRQDHETFIKFLEDYYKFLEQDGQTLYVSKNFARFMDVDQIKADIDYDTLHGESHADDYTSYHAFLEKKYYDFIRLIPKSVLADRNMILKHVKDFYRARGTEKGARFLARILLGKEISVYYPKSDVLRASDGKWYIEKSLKVTDIATNNVANSDAVTLFNNYQVRGKISNATATVESVDSYYDKVQLIRELKISGISGTFVDGEQIFTYVTVEGNEKYLSANLYSGVIVSYQIQAAGNNYTEGTIITPESVNGAGSGGQLRITKTTKSSLVSIGASFSGAGFRAGDSLLITGGGGTGASANVKSVFYDNYYHPNSYNIVASTIQLEANTAINNTKYSNLVSSITDPANAWISNSMSFWSYSNTGPVAFFEIIDGGQNFSSPPTLDIIANTAIRSLGILGRMEIVSGGVGYAVNDIIKFENVVGGYGCGGQAKVSTVDANGSITYVQFQPMAGQITGGTGYENGFFPTANIISANTQAYGANVVIRALLGDGEILYSSNSSIGSIEEITIVSGGQGYNTAPIINLTSLGDGTAQVNVSIITGAFTYPGRYLNDDGQPSAYNFLQDNEYYHSYSYVVQTDEPISKYRKPFKDLTHPAGMKMFGEYQFKDNTFSNLQVSSGTSSSSNLLYTGTYSIAPRSGTYRLNNLTTTYAPETVSATYTVPTHSELAVFNANSTNIVITLSSHGYDSGKNVHVTFPPFTDNSSANLVNGQYRIIAANLDYITISGSPNTFNNLSGVATIYNKNFVRGKYAAKDSSITINYGDHGYKANDVLVMQFFPVAANVVNNRYVVSSANTDYFTVGTINSNLTNTTGNVRVFNPKMTISSNSYIGTYANVFLKFSTSDTSLANIRYTVNTSIVPFASSDRYRFTVLHKDIANANTYSGNVSVYTTSTIITSNTHGRVVGEPVYVLFNDGDTANAVNGVYTITGTTSNTFNVTLSHPALTSGNGVAYTKTLTINVVNHLQTTNNKVKLWFVDGDTANTKNGVYTITMSNNASNIHTFNVTTSNIVMTAGNVRMLGQKANVIITRTGHGYSGDANLRLRFTSGDLTTVTNGIFKVTWVNTGDSFNVSHGYLNFTTNTGIEFANSNGSIYMGRF